MVRTLISQVDQKALEMIKSMMANEIVPKPCRWYNMGEVEDMGRDKRFVEYDELIVEATVRKTNEEALTRAPQKRSIRWRTYFHSCDIFLGRNVKTVMEP
jgi:hypothetical protein